MAITSERRITIVLDTKGNARGLTETARNLERMSRGVDSLGGQMRGTTSDADALNREISVTNDRIRDLHAQVSKTRDLSLFGDINKEERRLRQLRRTLATVVPNIGPDFATKLGQDIGELPSKLRGAAYLSIGVFAAAAAPAIAGIISGAVLGAVGAGGVVGGAVLAAQDSRVAMAWKKLGGDLLTQLSDAASEFVDPMTDAAKTVGDAFRASGITDALRESVLLVDPLTKGVAGFVRELGPGLNAAVRGSLPVWHMLSTELPQTGAAIGDMLTSMSDASDGATLAFKDFLDMVQLGTRATGDLFAGLSEIYALTRNPILAKTFDLVPMFGLVEVIGKAAPKLRELTGTQQGYMFAVDNTAKGIDRLTEAEKREAAEAQAAADARRDAIRAMQDYNRAVDQGISNAANLDAAEDALQLGILDLNESIKDNGKIWNDSTREGLANRAALANVIDTLDRIRRAQIDSGIDAQTANAAYNDQITVLEKLGVKLGLTAQQIDDLIGDYKINIITTFSTRGQRVRLPSGDFRVSGGGRLIESDINLDLSRRVTGGVIFRQHGGPFGTHQPIVVGEKRAEVVEFDRPGRVYPSMGAWQASQGGAQTITLEVVSSGQSAFDEFMAGWIRKYVRVVGGGNVQTAFGR